jgi:hypothetical protein
MTLLDFIKLLEYNMQMRLLFNAYGHKVEVVKYRDDILEESYTDFLNMIVESIKPVWYDSKAIIQVSLKG